MTKEKFIERVLENVEEVMKDDFTPVSHFMAKSILEVAIIMNSPTDAILMAQDLSDMQEENFRGREALYKLFFMLDIMLYKTLNEVLED